MKKAALKQEIKELQDMVIGLAHNAGSHLHYKAALGDMQRAFKKFRRKIEARDKEINYLKVFIFDRQLAGALEDKIKGEREAQKKYWLGREKAT